MRLYPKWILLGMVVGILLALPWLVTDANAALSRCHKQLCNRTFHLRPHQRRVWVTHDKATLDERAFIRVVIHGQLVLGRDFGHCAAEFNAYGLVALADVCIHPGQVTFIVTDTLNRRGTVTVSYAFLGSAVAD